MGDDRTLQLLRSVRALEGETERSLAALANAAEEVEVSAGERLTREGVVGHEAFVVVEGVADVFSDGERLGSVGVGDIVGAVATVDVRLRSATVRARTPMRV